MTTTHTDVPIQLTLRGEVPHGSAAYAVKRIEHTVRRPPAVAQHVHVVVTVEPNPAYERPVRIEVSAIVAGRPIRAHVEATTVTEAADLVVDRLQQRLDRTRERTRTVHRRTTGRAPQPRTPGDLPRRSAPRSGEADDGTPQIVKRKTYALEPMTAEQAADEMDLLDHDFYLFADAGTGADALVHRRDDGSVDTLGPEAPTLTTAQAKTRLEVAADSFVFYRDPADQRARVLYRRYDGRYGLLVAS